MLDALNTITRPGGKFPNLRYPDAWKMLFWNHLLHIKYKSGSYLGVEIEITCNTEKT